MGLKIKPDPTFQRNLMAFGWECEKGWHPIIQELIDKLVKIEDCDFELLQVKEKFGSLRFYVSSETHEVSDLIEDYETYSAHICEVCGEFYTAKTRNKKNGSWLKTLCDKCAEEFGYE